RTLAQVGADELDELVANALPGAFRERGLLGLEPLLSKGRECFLPSGALRPAFGARVNVVGNETASLVPLGASALEWDFRIGTQRQQFLDTAMRILEAPQTRAVGSDEQEQSLLVVHLVRLGLRF